MITHTPFRPWCPHCVRGQAVAKPHRKSESLDETGRRVNGLAGFVKLGGRKSSDESLTNNSSKSSSLKSKQSLDSAGQIQGKTLGLLMQSVCTAYCVHLVNITATAEF